MDKREGQASQTIRRAKPQRVRDMTAKIVPFAKRGRVRLEPIDTEDVPPDVRQLLAIMEARERK
jgi:hypothetical protein